MKITGTIQGGPRLAQMLREQGKKVGIMQRIHWQALAEFLVGFAVLVGGCLLIVFGVPFLAVVLGGE